MKLKNSIKSIAIGSFDGIHIAHQELISQAQAVVIIEKNSSTLTVGYKRTRYINKPCFFYHFDKLKSLSAKNFIDKLCLDFPKLENIIVGYDFAFGYKKEGNTSLLEKLFRGKVTVIKEIKYKNISVHSRSIKKFIKDGDIELANMLLNHHYSIDGIIIKGQGVGKKELVATLNLKIYNHLLPKNGVYATKTLINNRWLNSVSFLGHRETTDGSFAIETHILDNDIGVIKGNISLKFISFIRNNQKFTKIETLKEQINLDIQKSKMLFNQEYSSF